MNKFFRFVTFFMNPFRCLFCGVVCKTNAIACDKCLSKVNPQPHFCLPPSASRRNLTACMGAFPYHDPMIRKGFLNYKFEGYETAYPLFAKAMFGMDYAAAKEADVVTAVPMDKVRQGVRGYNQSEHVGREYARLLNKPYEELLIKTKTNQVQSTIADNKSRAENVKDCYVVIDRSRIEGKRVLIVDDVYTTGATMKECARMLKKAGAKMVIGAVICYA